MPDSTYKPAQVPSSADLILLNPRANNHSKTTILDELRRWDADISVFNIPQLARSPPHDGFFTHATPECFLSRPIFAPHSTTRHPDTRGRPPQQDHRALPVMHSHPHPATSSSRVASRQPHLSSGESTRCYTARTPLIQAVSGSVKPLSILLREANSLRPQGDKITVPRINQPQNPSRPLQICFKFCTERSGGCILPVGQSCRHIHLDLADTPYCRSVAPSSFYRDFQKFIDHESVRRHYRPTQAFRDFLGRL